MEENKDATQKDGNNSNNNSNDNSNNNKGCWGCLTIFGVGEVVGLVMALLSGGSWEQVETGVLKIGPLIAAMIVLLVVLGWMIVHFNDNDDGDGNGGGDIPAPSKQTMRMLKRNIRRRWL